MGLPTNEVAETDVVQSLRQEATVRRARSVADFTLAGRFPPTDPQVAELRADLRALALGFRVLDMPDGKENADPTWLLANGFVLADGGVRPTYFSRAIVPNPTKPAGYHLPVLAIGFPFLGQNLPRWEVVLFGHQAEQNWHPNREWVRTMVSLLRTLGYNFDF
jgi:hypothetical protein